MKFRMSLAIIDVVLIVILAGFVFYGLFFGLIKSIGSLLGVVFGAIIASRLYLYVYNLLGDVFFGFNNLGKVLIFIILFSVISKIISLLFSLLDKAIHFLVIIPFLKTFNKLGGVIFGFITGSFSIGIVLFVVSKYSFIDHWIGKWLVDSKLAPLFVKFSNIIMPFLPEVLKKINGLI